MLPRTNTIYADQRDLFAWCNPPTAGGTVAVKGHVGRVRRRLAEMTGHCELHQYGLTWCSRPDWVRFHGR